MTRPGAVTTADMGGGRPLRVLVLDHTAELGGAELALVRLAEALGPDVSLRALLCADGPLRDRLEAAGVAVDVVPLDPRVAGATRGEAARPGRRALTAAPRLVGFVVRAARRARALRPDVVHTTSLKADLLGVPVAWWARAPLVWHVHDRVAADYLPARAVRLLRWGARRLPAAVVVNAEAVAATLPVASVVAHPGFAPGQERTSPRPPRPAGRGPVVGILGRVSPTKGQRELVAAWPQVLRHHPDAVLRVVGAPAFGAEAYAAEVRAAVTGAGLDGSVEWVGFTDDPAAALDGFDVAVHASPVPEPFGQVVVEALVRGVPVVATDAGGVPEILRRPDGDLGVLVPAGDEDALADALVAVLDDPAGAAARAERGRRDALERFPVALTAQTVSGVWRDVVARAR